MSCAYCISRGLSTDTEKNLPCDRFEVDFATDFKKLVELRDKMLIFLGENRRDYMPVFDGEQRAQRGYFAHWLITAPLLVVVDSFPEQGKLILKADIKYKTNWQ